MEKLDQKIDTMRQEFESQGKKTGPGQMAGQGR